MAAIEHHVTIKAPAEKIYALYTTIDGFQKWLRESDGWKITGDENEGGILTFSYRGSIHQMLIVKLDPNKEVKHQCTVGHPEWLGTTVDFIIEDKGDEKVLHFAHAGWADKSEFFEMCNQVWGGNMQDIKKLAEAG